MKHQSITRRTARAPMRRVLLELGVTDLRVETRNVHGLCQIEIVKPCVKWPNSARQLLRPTKSNGPCQRIIVRGRTWIRVFARARHIAITADARKAA